VSTQTKNHQHVRLRSFWKDKGLWLLILVGTLYFYRPIFLDDTFFLRDLGSMALPMKQVLVDFINSGELPLWDQTFFGGKPYMGDVGESFWHPFNLLYLFLPLLKAFNLSIVLSFLSCAVFTYLFARVLGFQPFSSVIAGIVYGFCGYTLSIGTLPGLIVDIPFLPLLFLFWHLFLVKGQGRWFVLAVAAGAVQAVNGSHEMNVISLLSLLGWSIFYPYSRLSCVKKCFLWFMLGVFIAGVSLIQIIPTFEMLLQSSRTAMAQSQFSKWSLHPLRLPQLVFAGFLFYMDPLTEAVHYWGEHIVDGGMPFIISIYVGSATLFLGMLGGLWRKNVSETLPRRVRIFLLFLILFPLMLALGRFLPFFQLYYSYISAITLIRYPIRFLIAAIFPLALLAGYGAEIHFGSPHHGHEGDKPSGKILAVCWGILLILVGFTLLLWRSDIFADRFQRFFFKQPGKEMIRYGLLLSFLHTTAVWGLVSLLYYSRKLKKTNWQAWALTGVLTLDLLIAGRGINPFAPDTLFTNTPQVVPVIQRDIGNGRLFRVERSHETNIARFPTPNNALWVSRWYYDSLAALASALHHIPIIFHSDPTGLAPTRMMTLTNLVLSLPWEKRLPLLSMGAVKTVLTHKSLSVPGLRRLAAIPNWSGSTFFVYHNETAVERVEFVTDWEYMTTDEDVLKAISDPEFDPRSQVILEDVNASLFEPSPARSQFPELAVSSSGDCPPARIIPGRATSHSAIFTISTDCRGFLVFADTFYPGWRVSVDKKSAPVLQANYAFSAVFLPPGTHEVRRTYRPRSLAIGSLSSFCCVCVLLLMASKGWLINVKRR